MNTDVASEGGAADRAANMRAHRANEEPRMVFLILKPYNLVLMILFCNKFCTRVLLPLFVFLLDVVGSHSIFGGR